MSTQGATLRRGTIELPIWPVAVLVVAALAAVIALSTIDTVGTIAPARTLVTVTDAQRLANSTAAVREQGATLPVIVGISHVAPSLHGATIGTGWDSMGGQNEALHRQYSPPQDGVAKAPVWGPIMVNGEPCMQCR